MTLIGTKKTDLTYTCSLSAVLLLLPLAKLLWNFDQPLFLFPLLGCWSVLGHRPVQVAKDRARAPLHPLPLTGVFF